MISLIYSHWLPCRGFHDAHITGPGITAICEKYPPNYLIPSFDAMKYVESESDGSRTRDKLYDQALQIVLEAKNASTTFLQRKLKIGYARAASLMDELEENGIVSPPEGSKPRRVLATSSED